MSPEKRDAIRARSTRLREDLTHAADNGCMLCSEVGGHHPECGLDHAPTDLAALLAEVERLQAERSALESTARELVHACSRIQQAVGCAPDADLVAAVERLRTERDHWEESASMGCENPPEDCQCPGCMNAADRAGRLPA